MNPRQNKRDKGYVLIFTAVLAIFLIAFMGLAIDVGYMGYQRARIQLAADGAASAAGTEAGLGSTSTVVTTAGKRGAALNGFTDGAGGVTVTINNPPTSGDFVNNTGYYEAIVSQSSGTFFMRMMNFPTLNISARAVSSKATGSNSQSTPCIYVLDGTMTNALTITGTVTVNVCAIQVNSNATSAMKQTGSAVTTASYINLVGSGYTKTGSGTITPTPSTNQASISDPLSTRAAPTYTATCDYTNYSTSSAVTLNPGVYCGGISITGSNNTTFNAGTYILLGGGFNSSSSGTMTGTGVTFYLTKNASYSYGGVSISGSGTYNWIAFVASVTSGTGTSFTTSYALTGTKAIVLGDGLTTTSCQVIVN